MNRINLKIVFAVMVFSILGLSQMVYAWPGVDSNGVAICTASDMQDLPQIVSDGQEGAIITWEDNRNGNNDIYAQRIDSTGTVKWAFDGVAVCTDVNEQINPQIVMDGQGGAIITWQDARNEKSDIYTQAIDSNGVVKWTSNGVAICTVINYRYNPQLVSDGQGGAIIAWYDTRNGSGDIYAQAVDSTGILKWTPLVGNALDGISICTANDNQLGPQLVSDGQGGAIIVWQDYRNTNDYDIYAQAVDSTGTVKWTENGVPICMSVDAQQGTKIVTDGQGGAIFTWYDKRSGVYDIYAQSIDSNGVVKWTSNGVAICTATNIQQNSQIVTDGQGGAIIAWQDKRSGTNDVYAQAIDGTGTVKWAENGIAVCMATNVQQNPQIVSDGQKGAIIAWQDKRSGAYDIYAQAVDSTGAVKWTSDGVAICTAINVQQNLQLVSNGQNGAIITWGDYRNDTNYTNTDIYAQSINISGLVPVELSDFMTE